MSSVQFLAVLMTSDQEDELWQRNVIAAMDLALAGFRSCSTKANQQCGCPLVGLIDPVGHAKFVQLDAKACAISLSLLKEKAPVEAHFWDKRMAPLPPPSERGPTKTPDDGDGLG